MNLKSEINYSATDRYTESHENGNTIIKKNKSKQDKEDHDVCGLVSPKMSFL